MTLEQGTIMAGITFLLGGAGWLLRLHNKVERHDGRLEQAEKAFERNDADHREIKHHVEYIRARIDVALNGHGK